MLLTYNTPKNDHFKQPETNPSNVFSAIMSRINFGFTFALIVKSYNIWH